MLNNNAVPGAEYQQNMRDFYKNLDDFYRIHNEGMKVVEQNEMLFDKAQRIINDINSAPQLKNSLGTSPSTNITSPIKEAGVGGGSILEGIQEIKGSLDSIADFCKGVTWVVKHPGETIKIILKGLCDVVQVLALLVCAGSILMTIFGHKGGLKYVPVSIVVYALLKILVVVL